METIFMNYVNSKTSNPNRFVLNLRDKIDLKRGNKRIALQNLSIYYTWKNIKKEYNNNKFKITAPDWSEEFLLPDGSYSISSIQDYFEYIIKKHETIEDSEKSPIKIYVNSIKNRITFKIKNGYELELQTPETMRLLGSTEQKVTKDKNGEAVPHLEITEVILIHCNLVNNSYQNDSRVLYTFVPNKSFGQLIEISPHSPIFLKTFKSEFSYIEVWFTDQNFRALEIEDRVNLTLVII